MSEWIRTKDGWTAEMPFDAIKIEAKMDGEKLLNIHLEFCFKGKPMIGFDGPRLATSIEIRDVQGTIPCKVAT